MLPDTHLKDLLRQHKILTILHRTTPYHARISVFFPQNPNHESYMLSYANLYKIRNFVTNLINDIEADWRADLYLDEIEKDIP